MLAKKKQTVLIFTGISFACMIYVVIAGVQLGMREYLSEQLLNNTAHIIISGKEDYVILEDVQQSMFSPEQHIIVGLYHIYRFYTSRCVGHVSYESSMQVSVKQSYGIQVAVWHQYNQSVQFFIIG